MNVTCTKCGKKYVIADDKVAGKTSVKIRCKQCQSLIAVAVGPLASPSGVVAMAAGAPPPPRDSEVAEGSTPEPSGSWYAMVAGKQVGPFDLRALQQKASGGEVTLRTYLWKAGMSDWKRASEVPEVSPIFAGLSSGATATDRTQTSTRSSGSRPGVGRDVAVANETPSFELSRGAGATAAPPAEATEPGAPVPEAVAAAAPPAGPEAPPSASEATQADATQPQAAHDPAHDPFAQLAPLKSEAAPASGENTKFFIARAGVNKRNPPWKIALFALALVGLPVAVTALLSSFHVVELPTVTRTTEDGREVQETFLSKGGMTGLRDLLTGEAERKKEEAAQASRAREAAAQERAAAAARSGSGETPEAVARVTPPRPVNPKLADLYGKDELPSRGPKVRKDEGETPQVNAAGLSQEAAMKVVADKSKAFQQCVEAALHRNPNLAVGNILLVLTVGASGAVKSAVVEPRKHEGSDWAQCMGTTARRIVFPTSDGETQLELPFKVGVAISP